MEPDVNSSETSAFQFGSSITLVPLALTFGQALISANAFAELQALDTEQIIQLYTLVGVVLFRGFNVTKEAFERFTDRFTTGYIVNASLTREPVSVDGTTQTVNSGAQLIPPHAEMAYTPFRPTSGRPATC